MLQLLTARKDVNSVTKKSPTKLLSPGGWPYECIIFQNIFQNNKIHIYTQKYSKINVAHLIDN